jgi:hypothetical protein
MDAKQHCQERPDPRWSHEWEGIAPQLHSIEASLQSRHGSHQSENKVKCKNYNFLTYKAEINVDKLDVMLRQRLTEELQARVIGIDVLLQMSACKTCDFCVILSIASKRMKVYCQVNSKNYLPFKKVQRMLCGTLPNPRFSKNCLTFTWLRSFTSIQVRIPDPSYRRSCKIKLIM